MARPRQVSDEEIVAATARVVTREGPFAFTLAQVGREAGISAPGIVQRFGGKRQLLLALARRSRSVPAESFARARRDHASPLDALAEGLVLMMPPFDTPESFAHNLAFLQVDLTDPEFHGHAVAFFDAFRAGVRALLQEALDAKELAPCDVDELARVVEVTYNGAVIVWAIRREGDAAGSLRRDVALVLSPWRAKPRRPSPSRRGTP